MKIKNVVKKDEKIYILVIKDETETYPIRVESLHNPVIFESLVADGWELYNLPFDFRKGSVTLEDLPVIDYKDLKITPEQEQDMVDMMATTYKEVDLRAKMVVGEKKYIQWERGTYLINSREELINFLAVAESTKFEMDIETLYMPLNSFVNPVALFTPKEYFDPKNRKLRDMIEKRRSISFRNFSKMVNKFIEQGLPVNYTAKQLVDKYFSWGICGLRLDVIGRITERTNLRVGAPIIGTKEEEMPYVRETRITYLDTSGKVFRNAAIDSSRWKPAAADAYIERKRKELVKLGFQYVCPMKVVSIIYEDVTTITAEDLKVEYSESMLSLNYYGESHITNTLTVASLDNIYKPLPPHLWNIATPEGKKAIYEESYLRAICRELDAKLVERSSVSSTKALQAVGVAIGSVFWPIMYGDEELEKSIAGEKSSSMSATEIIARYLRGQLNTGTDMYDRAESFVNDVMDGVANIDNVADGISLDCSASVDQIYEILYVAHYLLEIPLDAIYERVRESAIEEYIDFCNDDKVIRLGMKKRNEAIKGYHKDIARYKAKMAEEAPQWLYVTAAIRELGTTLKCGHAAVECLVFDRSRNSSAVEKYFRDIVDEEIKNNVPFKNQEAYSIFIPALTANAVFQAGIFGQIKMPKEIGGKVIKIADDLKSVVASYLKKGFESTTAIASACVYQGNGQFTLYCANATITPSYVIPNEGVTLKEKPFIPLWLNTAGSKFDKLRESWYNRGFIDSPKFTGYQVTYKNVCIIEYPVTDRSFVTENSRMSVPAYYRQAEEYRKEFPRDQRLIVAPSHVSLVFPGLMLNDEEPEVQRRPEGESGEFQWLLGDVVKITREEVLSRNAKLRELFHPISLELESKFGFKKFEGYASEDFYLLNRFEDLKADKSFGNNIKLLLVYNTSDAVLNTNPPKDIKYVDVQELDETTYAVSHLCGRKYLTEDCTGAFWEVII
jgi:hypothetical protein